MPWYCIVFDIIAVYYMSPHCILWYGMVLYFIRSYCTVSHCYVPLLKRAGELQRSASSHFLLDNTVTCVADTKTHAKTTITPVLLVTELLQQEKEKI